MVTTANQNNIKHIIGITAGKGGVGKSTITCLLANECSRLGHSVAILDANFSAASISTFYNVKAPLLSQHGIYTPLQSETAIKILPANMLVDDGNQVFIWKEEMAGDVIAEVFHKTHWGDLDYLLIDLPPATMEGAISILQTLPFSGVICVTQPQAIAAQWTKKAVQIFRHTGIPLIGLVENMASYQTDDAQSSSLIWGPSHTDDLAANLSTTVLARIPFRTENCLLCDQGKVEDILLPESIQLYEATTNSLSTLQLENKTHTCDTHISLEQFARDFTSIEIEPAEAAGAYSATVNQLIVEKENLGSLDHPDGEGHFMGKCGDRMQIDIQLSADTISAAKFQTDGCGVTIACGSMITQMVMNKSLQQASEIKADELVEALDGLPDDHLHCADLAVMTLREALVDAIEGHKTLRE
jgi:Mrp family chromosome partitioning ATPase/NifU-like protein involved in Fe-S cluster formation